MNTHRSAPQRHAVAGQLLYAVEMEQILGKARILRLRLYLANNPVLHAAQTFVSLIVINCTSLGATDNDS